MKILFLEDNKNDALLVEASLEGNLPNLEFVHVNNKSDFETAVLKGDWNCILSDYSVPGYSGFAALSFVRQHLPDVPVLLLSGSLSEDEAVASLKAGAVDYIIKSRLQRLVPAIERAVTEARQRAERKAAEARIREQAALLDKATDAICVMDMDSKILFWNSGAERIYGWKASEIIGKNAAGFLFPAPASALDEFTPDLLEKGEWSGELEQETKSGKTIIVESRWTLMCDEQRGSSSILIINTDVTEKRHYHSEWLRTQRVETIGALAGTIAHDMNNFLAPIFMASELLEPELQGEEARRTLSILRNSAQRCSEMVNQILSFSRGNREGRKVTDLSELIGQVQTLARQVIPRAISLHSEIPPGHLIKADVTQMHQLFMNLIVNARDAMPKGGKISIEAHPVHLNGKPTDLHPEPLQGNFVCISVTDTGTGIPPDIAKNIFQPFFTTKAQGKGTGLGLSTVVSIVKAHDGFLELKTAPAGGSSFQIYLPEHSQAAA